MDNKLDKVKEILMKYEQTHLIQFYSELTETQKSFLLNQILNIDFQEILDLYEESKINVVDATEDIERFDFSIKSSFSTSIV